MMIIKGKYNEAYIYTDVIEESAIAQVQEMCDSEVFKDSKIRLMPDVHTGARRTIGTTLTLTDKVVPNMVGVDIGCGMEVIKIAEKSLDLPKLDGVIYKNIPSGMNKRETPHEYSKNIDLKELRSYKFINDDLAIKNIGTLGGGNHFIEANKDDEGNIYIVIHSGSRHLGLEVAKYYQEQAYNQMCGNAQYQLDIVIKKLKEEGRAKEIQKTVEELKKTTIDIDKEMAYVSDILFDDYIHDMKIVQKYAVLNRQAIVDIIVKEMGVTVVEQFTTIHNYIDTENMILRKGAVSAKKNEKLIIPINMRDGSLICIGKGNEEWNSSAPHGAGRILSRGKARATLSMEEFEKQMSGIYTTSVKQSTIDESPMAYKSAEDIVDNIAPTVDIVKRIVPIYNFKASE